MSLVANFYLFIREDSGIVFVVFLGRGVGFSFCLVCSLFVFGYFKFRGFVV